MNVHRSPIGEDSPKGSMSWLGKGLANWDGMTLSAPYSSIAAASANRM